MLKGRAPCHFAMHWMSHEMQNCPLQSIKRQGQRAQPGSESAPRGSEGVVEPCSFLRPIHYKFRGHSGMYQGSGLFCMVYQENRCLVGASAYQNAYHFPRTPAWYNRVSEVYQGTAGDAWHTRRSPYLICQVTACMWFASLYVLVYSRLEANTDLCDFWL